MKLRIYIRYYICLHSSDIMADTRELGKPFIALCLAMNIGLSISIVLLNKTVYTRYGFPNMTMTCLLFIFTTA